MRRELTAAFAGLTAVVVTGAVMTTFAASAEADTTSLYAAANVGVPGSVVAIDNGGDVLVASFAKSDLNTGYLVPKGRTPVRLKSLSSSTPFVLPTDMNDSEVSVGFGDAAGDLAQWSPTGTVTRLTLPAGSSSGVGDARIDDHGTVVATLTGPGSTTQVVEWTNPATPHVVLSAASGQVHADGISRTTGVVAGVLDKRAVLVDPAGRVHRLATPSGVSSEAVAVNDDGVAIGYTGTTPVLWNADGRRQTITDAGDIVAAINDNGTIVGTRTGAQSEGDTAYIRQPDGVVDVLPGLAHRPATSALCVNAAGVVGGSSNGEGGARGTVWTRIS